MLAHLLAAVSLTAWFDNGLGNSAFQGFDILDCLLCRWNTLSEHDTAGC